MGRGSSLIDSMPSRPALVAVIYLSVYLSKFRLTPRWDAVKKGPVMPAAL